MMKTCTEQTLTLIQISDTHLMAHADAEFVGMNPEASFHGLIEHIVQTHPQIDAIIHTGDLAQIATIDTYQRYLSDMGKLNIPFFQIPGNHDDLGIFPYHQTGPISSVAIGNWRIILMTSAVTGKVDGHIDQAQLEQLKVYLEEFKDNPVLIACHHNPLHMHSKWLDQHRLKNPQDLLNIVTQHPQVKAIIHGHVHQEFAEQLEHVQILATPSTCVQFKPQSEDFAFDEDAAPGYRCLHLLSNGDILSEIFRVPSLLTKINSEISGY